MGTRVQEGQFKWEDVVIPIKIYWENRRNVRFAIRQKQAIMRMPLRLPQHKQEEEINRFKAWLSLNLNKHTNLQSRFRTKTYADGQEYRVGHRSYKLHIEDLDRKSSTAILKKPTIELKLSDKLDEKGRVKTIQKLLSKVIGADYLPAIQARVHLLNVKHFNQPIKDIRLKYTHSRWGSCKNDGVITLSTRLLFAPQEVQDYVIIHELAHLIELNHSSRFWALVEQAMPNYKAHEKWLKEYDAECEF